jgi:glycosyltransferase involved in cell wall biosynthesis
MNVLAFMPVYNEADILPWTLDHMVRQGIRVHVIDGWSDDGGYEIAARFNPMVTVERFPRDGRADLQSCRLILARIEELAMYSGADWCYLSDADEIRRSPEIETTLHDMIVRVDEAGYNAVDHRVYAFFPVDNGWLPWQGGWEGDDISPEEYFRHYNETDMLCRIPQEKLWKSGYGRVDLHSTGGHEVRFPGKLVYPVKFVLKHYPFRNQEQALRKMRTRMERRDESEHRDGWGVHYDEYLAQPGGFTGLWQPGELSVWEDMRSAEPTEDVAAHSKEAK